MCNKTSCLYLSGNLTKTIDYMFLSQLVNILYGQVLKKYMSGGNVGHDKEGSPVRVELFGHLDMKGLMYSARKSDLEKVKLKQCEQHLKDWEIMSKKVCRTQKSIQIFPFMHI